MQTFLPYPDFAQSARVLDSKRLGKQRVEAMQILKALTLGSSGWRNHPAVKMWRGYELALQTYHDEMVLEWKSRGFKNTMQLFLPNPDDIVRPPWIGSPAFHDSHKSNLLRKDPAFYGKYSWDVPNNLPYVWPCSIHKSH